MADFKVLKTLVIGLGSSGTRVCEALAERIDWEVRSLGRAPWVEFLCIETDNAMKSRFNGTEHFRTLSITAQEYYDLVNNPQNYDASIALSRWADIETLKQLQGGAVSAGAGNIRMVGRLSLLYSRNYDMIKQAIGDRLARLRGLSLKTAEEKLNQGVGGSEDSVEFADSGTGLRVIVVGTLLGGTCSGTLNDMGIILRSITSKSERLIGMFTMPHPGYSKTMEPLAERRKKNAYHALLELNHYHNYLDDNRYKGLKYHDKAESEQILERDATPYDLVYLCRARDVSVDDERKLNNAIADRIFLNIFVPETDPMSTIVDIVTPPKNGLSFPFAAFGLSTIEYPVARIIEACQHKLLAHAINKWKDRKFEDDIETVLERLGLTIGVTNRFLRDGSGTEITPTLSSKLNEVLNNARKGKTEEARRALGELRSAFEPERAEGLRGLVVRTAEANRRKVADELIQSVQQLVAEHLLDYEHGPAWLASVVAAAITRLGELASWEPAEAKPGAANTVLDKIESTKSNALLGAFLLRDGAIRRLAPGLQKALGDELKAKLERAAKAVMSDSGAGARGVKGTLAYLREELEKLQKRLQNLATRLTYQAQSYSREAQNLEDNAPAINGFALFERAPNGTVAKEYREASPDDKIDGQAAEIIKLWQELRTGLMPADESADWLLKNFIVGQDAFDGLQLRPLEQQALLPYLKINDPNNKDIETRLFEAARPGFDPEKSASSAADAAQLFLPINDALGASTPNQPLKGRKLLLSKGLKRLSGALSIWTNRPPLAKQDSLNNPFRIVMIEEKYRFSLQGSLDITGVLSRAEDNEFRTYHTRRDIAWAPVAKEDVAKLTRARELLMLGVLHNILKLESGFLMMEWPQSPGEADDAALRRRRLPVREHLDEAVRMLAFSKTDAMNRRIDNAMVSLNTQIEARYQSFLNNFPEVAEANRKYVRFLQHQMVQGNAGAIKGWDKNRAIRVVLDYCSRSQDLMRALYSEFPPDEVMLDSLFRQKGDPRPAQVGGYFEEPGLYCKVCGGMVGQTREDALFKGLRCEFYPEDPAHPFGEAYNPFGI
jgi:hypothetical protein